MKSLVSSLMLGAGVAVFLCGCEVEVANRNSQGTTIVCFGDSLTAGYGAEEGKDYPSVLRDQVDLPVINAGVAGDTTGDALRRLESDVLSHDPKIVILTLGGNDFLRRIPQKETLKNIETIVDRIQSRGGLVVLAAVQTGFWGDVYAEDYKKLGRQKSFVVIPDVLKGILFDPRYKHDQIHPNSEGYRIMAERISQKIKPFLKKP
ncbi:MAG: arylesterase [Candidatus Omnitrophota bacterium]